MPPKFRINSNIDLAECRKIFKQHEKMDVPGGVISLKEQLFGPLPAQYGIFWKGKDDFILSRWSYTIRRFGDSGYQQKIEMMGRVEGTLDKPQFVIQTKNGAGMEILFYIVISFVLFSAAFSFMIVFGFLMNMFLCARFLKHLVNPKDSLFSRAISSR